jgi:hypothetical protein
MGQHLAIRLLAFVVTTIGVPVLTLAPTPSYAEQVKVTPTRPEPLAARLPQAGEADTSRARALIDLPRPVPAAPAIPAAPAAPAPPTVATKDPGPDPGIGDPGARVRAAFSIAVPEPWRVAIPVEIRLIGGTTSWADPTNVIQVARYHALGGWSHLVSVLAHEFGHLIAFRDGAGAFAGSAPPGWPYNSRQPAEAWADCVSEAFTYIVDPSHGLGACPSDVLAWTATWLATGPPLHTQSA